ncbi:MAG TPA: aminotransferase class V-fold PLP-dependent enzyme [Verrucomicrobiota bacterium]|nr:aminotransferase [Verrucomicrobiales bacterium]HRI16074.1 aminotransferase class V-fold PLP-dependent enzyme [Verrucomicrobiota bacterium]
MTPAELQANEELRRHEFPVVGKKIFLAHAAVCPLPRRVADAVAAHLHTATLDDQQAALSPGFVAETRRAAARALQAQPEEIALVGPTSLALSYIAAGLPWKRGQNILVYHDDYPSNVYPWMALADRGVQVRFLNVKELGRIRVFDVQGQVDEDTRLVALSSCHFVSGWRVEVESLGRWLRGRGIWFCVDAIQTLGAFRTTVAGVDFLAADSHKWLLGPCGAGVLYVRKELQAALQPIVHGWHNVRGPNFVAQDDISFRHDARRYEVGSQNLLGLAGLSAALSLLEAVGGEAIASDLARKRAWLAKALQEHGCEVLLPSPPDANTSGIITFATPGHDCAVLHARLAEAGIVTSLRTTRDERRWIRLSPHYYNTEAELARVIELL